MPIAKKGDLSRFFNYDTIIKDLKGKPYDFIIEAFKKRIEKWFIYPVDIIVERHKKEGHISFPIILIDCALVECLCQFYMGIKESSQKDYKKFLRGIVGEFSQKLKRRIIIKNLGRKIKIKDYADIFYYAFRCGLMHSAMIKPCGGIAGQPNLVQYYETEGVLAINPLLLHDRLKKYFYEYINILLTKKDKIRVANFRKKMRVDFAITVPAT